MIIRPATSTDRTHLRRAIVELQDYERRLHASRLPGEQVADAYLDWLLRQSSTVLMAESDGDFAGFVAGRIETTENLGETVDSNRFGLISDVCVMPEFRGQRMARQLLDAIDSDLRRAGVTRVRINALAANTAARASYVSAGFFPYEIMHEKATEPELNPAVAREATPADREWIGNVLRERWHATLITAHSEVIDAAGLPALVVDDRRGLATWRRVGNDAELMTLDAVPTGCGTGTVLIDELAKLTRAGLHAPLSDDYQRQSVSAAVLHATRLSAGRAAAWRGGRGTQTEAVDFAGWPARDTHP
jgi:ribosomal protein S18 acetylase RimI-like enzyme